MKVLIKKILIFFSIFIFSFFIIRFLFTRCNALENIINLYQTINENNNLMDNFLNFISALILALIPSIADYIKDKKIKSNEETPKISLLIDKVTNIRKNKWDDDIPEIVIGKGNTFIYLTLVLKNVGEGYIQNCIINNFKLINFNIISKDEEYKFCFRVCKNENKKFKKFYPIFIQFSDKLGKSYNKTMYLIIHEKKQDAELKTSWI